MTNSSIWVYWKASAANSSSGFIGKPVLLILQSGFIGKLVLLILHLGLLES